LCEQIKFTMLLMYKYLFLQIDETKIEEDKKNNFFADIQNYLPNNQKLNKQKKIVSLWSNMLAINIVLFFVEQVESWKGWES